MTTAKVRCSATAWDRNFGIRVECHLPTGHVGSHYWSRNESNRRLSASWYGSGVEIGGGCAALDKLEEKDASPSKPPRGCTCCRQHFVSENFCNECAQCPIHGR